MENFAVFFHERGLRIFGADRFQLKLKKSCDMRYFSSIRNFAQLCELFCCAKKKRLQHVSFSSLFCATKFAQRSKEEITSPLSSRHGIMSMHYAMQSEYDNCHPHSHRSKFHTSTRRHTEKTESSSYCTSGIRPTSFDKRNFGQHGNNTNVVGRSSYLVMMFDTLAFPTNLAWECTRTGATVDRSASSSSSHPPPSQTRRRRHRRRVAFRRRRVPRSRRSPSSPPPPLLIIRTHGHVSLERAAVAEQSAHAIGFDPVPLGSQRRIDRHAIPIFLEEAS